MVMVCEVYCCHHEYYWRQNYHISKVFEAPSPEPLNDEALRVVVAQPVTKMTVQPLSPLIDADGSVVGDVLAYVMDASNVEMNPPPPLP